MVYSFFLIVFFFFLVHFLLWHTGGIKKNNNNTFANIMLSNAMLLAIMALSHFGSVAHFDKRAMAGKKGSTYFNETRFYLETLCPV